MKMKDVIICTPAFQDQPKPTRGLSERDYSMYPDNFQGDCWQDGSNGQQQQLQPMSLKRGTRTGSCRRVQGRPAIGLIISDHPPSARSQSHGSPYPTERLKQTIASLRWEFKLPKGLNCPKPKRNGVTRIGQCGPCCVECSGIQKG